MSERVVGVSVSVWSWWPFAVGGLLGPTLGGVLKRWMALPAAAALGSFVAWMLALWLFRKFYGMSDWSVPRWLAASGGAALVTGLLTYFFPWA
ncbi:MAG TPA: hypothetical protein VF736_01255 [Pyrinomonadaceae bacterium]|jgi:hypothetical protein